MTEEVYERLAKRMDEFPIGAPLRPQLLEILEDLFEPEEAALALDLPPLPTGLSQLAEKLDLDPGRLEEMLERMADKGLVYCSKRGDERKYMLLPMVPGIFEMQFMKGEFSPGKHRLAELFEEYYHSGWGSEVADIKSSPTRVIPVEEQIPGGSEVMPYERVSKFIKEGNYMALTTCFCRHEMELLGRACDAPKEVCMTFGPFAEFLVDRGYARNASVDEMLSALETAEEAGLVHVSDNIQDKVNFICNCCGCCCGFLRGITELGIPGAVASSGFLAVVDEEECTGCGVCEEKCQLNAITLEDDVALVDPLGCLGCGACANLCDFDAITLERRADAMVPYRDLAELNIALLKEKGAS